MTSTSGDAGVIRSRATVDTRPEASRASDRRQGLVHCGSSGLAEPTGSFDTPLGCLVAALLLAPLPLTMQVVGAAIFVAVVHRPQPILLGGALVVPLSSGALTTLGLLMLMIIVTAMLAGSAGMARGPGRIVWALVTLALWITLSFLGLRKPEILGGPSTTDLAQPIVGLAVAVAAALFPPKLRDAARISIVAVGLVGVAVLNSPVNLNGVANAFGLNSNYIAAMMSLLMAGCLIRASRWELIATCAVWPLGLIVLARTESRAGLVAVGVAVAVRIVLSDQGRIVDRRHVAVAAAVFGLLALTAPQIYSIAQGRYFGSRDFSGVSGDNLQRTTILTTSLQIAADHPIEGVGYGNFATVAAGTPGVYLYLNAHDEYARLVAELGVGGLILFLLPVTFAVRRVLGTARASLLPALLCFLTSILFGDELASIATSYLFWVILGMCLASRQGDRAHREPSTSKRQGWGPSGPTIGLGESRNPARRRIYPGL